MWTLRPILWLVGYNLSAMALSMKLKPNPPIGIDIEFHHSGPRLALLKWNTILEDFQAEAVTDRVLRVWRNPFETPAHLDNRVHAQYRKVFPEHFVVIGPPARESYTKTLDLRNWFDIKADDSYSVELTTDFFVAEIPEGRLSLDIERWEIPTMHDVFFSASTLTRLSPKIAATELAPESTRPAKKLAKRFPPVPCVNDLAVAVDQARTEAKALAGFTNRNFDRKLWQSHFNGIKTVQKFVGEVYSKIEGWDSSSGTPQELCDITKTDPICARGVAAYRGRGPLERIVFCDYFFSDEVQSNKDCEACADDGPMDLLDASGAFLHELTHFKSLVGRDIRDGECI